jgi:hypothetical protein
MDSLPQEIVVVIAQAIGDLWSVILLSKVSKWCHDSLCDYIEREKKPYMLVESGATRFGTLMKFIPGTKMRFTGILAKAVSANTNGCVMAIGIDGYCYVSGEKTRLVEGFYSKSPPNPSYYVEWFRTWHWADDSSLRTWFKIRHLETYCRYSLSRWIRVSDKKVKQIATTDFFNVFVTEDGELWAWGVNYVKRTTGDTVFDSDEKSFTRPTLFPQPKEIDRVVVGKDFVRTHFVGCDCLSCDPAKNRKYGHNTTQYCDTERQEFSIGYPT